MYYNCTLLGAPRFLFVYILYAYLQFSVSGTCREISVLRMLPRVSPPGDAIRLVLDFVQEYLYVCLNVQTKL